MELWRRLDAAIKGNRASIAPSPPPLPMVIPNYWDLPPGELLMADMVADTVLLSPEHIAFADDLGRRRQAAAVAKGRKPKNGAPTDPEKALAIAIKGTRAETALFLFLRPVRWASFAKNIYGLADFDDFIDAKGITSPRHSLIVQQDDDPNWAYVLMDGSQHPFWRCRGWMWGREAKQEKITDPHGGRAAHFVGAGGPHFKPLEELVDILRARQGRREGRL